MEKLENLNSLGPRGRQATYCLLGVPCNSFLFSNFIVAKYTLTYLLTYFMDPQIDPKMDPPRLISGDPKWSIFLDRSLDKRQT